MGKMLAIWLDPPASPFGVATKITTPLMLAGLVVLVLYALFRGKLTDLQAKLLFSLALVSIVLGVGAYLVEKLWPVIPQRVLLDGRVFSPPDKKSRGVPKATVLFLLHGHPPKTVTTDEQGYFSFVIESSDMGKPAHVSARANGYEDSEEKEVITTPSDDLLEFGLVAVPTQTAQTTLPIQVHHSTPPVALAAAPENTMAAVFDPACMNGEWREHLMGRPDTATMSEWNFSVAGNVLTGVRGDNFARFSLHQFGPDWKGDMTWGSGEVWHNVALTPSANCTLIGTNQSWSFSR